MRFTWLSNCPWTYTGYGTQTALFTPRLQKMGHNMAVISTWGHQGAPINWDAGVQIFGNSHHPFAMDVLYGHSRSWQADALITLMDTWVFDLGALRGDLKWIPWYPIDTDPMPGIIHEKLSKAFTIISMSKYGQEQAEKLGLSSEYVPLGIDANVYAPMEQAKARKDMFFPEDKFIIGMVAMNKGNPSRKAFNQTIEAFAMLKKKHPDCVLYLHTLDGTRTDNTVNLPATCDAYGLSYGYTYTQQAKEVDVLFADQYRYLLGYPPEAMRAIFSLMDVHSLVTMGEGFGIPLIEAQACGTPVIAGDWTAMSELVFSGWKVDKKDTTPLFTNLAAFHYLPHAAAIAEQMEAAYNAKGKNSYRKAARKAALAYDADRITQKYWKPVMDKIADRMSVAQVPANLDANLDVLL